MVIKLGLALAFSGPYSKTAETQRQGAKLAVEEINEEGGLLGQELEILERDTELDVGKGLNAVEELIKDEEIDLLVANLSAEVANSTASLAHSAEIPYMACCQTVRKFHSKHFMYKGSFTPYTLNVQSMRTAARFADDSLEEPFFAIVANYGWGHDSWKVLKEDLESLEVDYDHIFHPLNAENLDPYLEKAVNSDANTLFLLNFGKDQEKALKCINEQGINDRMEIIAPVTTLTLAKQIGGEFWEGIYGGLQYYHSANNSKSRKFSEKMTERFDNPGDSYSAASYTAVKELCSGVRTSGSLEIDKITKALHENPRFAHTKSGERWRKCDNQAIQDWYIVEGKDQSDQEKWDLFEIRQKMSGEELLPDCEDYR
jgi:branched-chain amino acid transport system substrate-binding protein